MKYRNDAPFPDPPKPPRPTSCGRSVELPGEPGSSCDPACDCTTAVESSAGVAGIADEVSRVEVRSTRNGLGMGPPEGQAVLIVCWLGALAKDIMGRWRAFVYEEIPGD